MQQNIPKMYYTTTTCVYFVFSEQIDNNIYYEIIDMNFCIQCMKEIPL